MRAQTSQNQIVSVSLPLELIKQARIIAQEMKSSRSQIFQQALRQYILLAKWKELQAYGVKRSIELGFKPEDVKSSIDEYRKAKIENSR